MNLKKKILYISYDGILEPLGHSQVFKYISNSSYSENISLISFEKIEDLRNVKNLNNTYENLSKHKIDWHLS